ncbi:ATP-dependent helicase [Psychrobacillus glaciei]|uniref:ATP-dependent helicase n=1 Tax=Psychrobacillus glaciei TaxID=2283160 RepID=A0A5J6SPJ8_9BACI|nr:ATP-dependent helicase [Psychrobacillus glaciei]QFF99916.1 ATP-dependent helicase [Psychrobacillus glaciei]
MVAELINNIFLVNAPAGSGKTTKIKSMIISHKVEFPENNILCITYTKRAAEELKKDINSKGIYISTIHSFLHSFVNIYFSKSEIVDLYFEVFGDLIRNDIVNEKQKENITARNQRYIDKHGTLSFEVIKNNIKSIYYNESANDHLYKGGLSHDSLILFSEKIFDKFPKIKKRITQKYQRIFIDEYQDSASSVLRMFYKAVIDTTSNLYFLGDKMQQIYKNYDGFFEDELKTLNTEIKLDINHRSIPDIVSVLNNIYNDEEFYQSPSSKNSAIIPAHPPRVILCDNIHDRLEIEKSSYPDALLLFLLNQQRFNSIGAGELYSRLNRLEKYSYGKQLNAVNILSDNTNENSDSLFKLLFLVEKVLEHYKNSNLGSIIHNIKINSKIFDLNMCKITSHQHKVDFNILLSQIYDSFHKEHSIHDFLISLRKTNIFKTNYIDEIGDEYSEVLEVGLNEFKALSNYLNNPKVSTQHGVKGESHNSVFFIAEDSFKNPVVHMHKFLKLWTSTDLSLNSLESFYYEYNECVADTVNHIGCKISELNRDSYDTHSTFLNDRIEQLNKRFEGNLIFKGLYEGHYNKYLLRPNVSNIKECLKESTVYGVLSAYRLFYVGCSRAKKNLTIFIKKANVEEYSQNFIGKLERIGFSVED